MEENNLINTMILKQKLFKYITIYHNQTRFRMRNVFGGILKRLKNKGTITIPQMNSVTKFLIREPEFKDKDMYYLIEYFYPIIEIPPEPKKSKTQHTSYTFDEVFG